VRVCVCVCVATRIQRIQTTTHKYRPNSIIRTYHAEAYTDTEHDGTLMELAALKAKNRRGISGWSVVVHYLYTVGIDELKDKSDGRE
jgi:hypothetical protein